MARGAYTVTMKDVTLFTTAALTLAFVNPGSGAGFTSIRILRAWCSQGGSATSQQLAVQLVFQASAFPTLTSTAPVGMSFIEGASKIVGGTAGAAGTSGTNASAEGAGAKTVIIADSFNNLNGWLWVPTPDEVIEVSAGASSGFGLYLATAPTSALNWSAGITFLEI